MMRLGEVWGSSYSVLKMSFISSAGNSFLICLWAHMGESILGEADLHVVRCSNKENFVQNTKWTDFHWTQSCLVVSSRVLEQQ